LPLLKIQPRESDKHWGRNDDEKQFSQDYGRAGQISKPIRVSRGIRRDGAGPSILIKCKLHIDVDLHCDGLTVLGGWLEIPLADGLNCLFV
jgi:hypothetical protein